MHRVSITKINELMMFMEIIEIHSHKHTVRAKRKAFHVQVCEPSTI
jgi:hypothetical protein